MIYCSYLSQSIHNPFSIQGNLFLLTVNCYMR